MPLHLSIIGASAGVGLECVRVALARGHAVTTLSRGAVPVPDQPGLTRVQGSATRPDDLRRAVQGADAVLVCLGVGRRLGATTLFSDFGRALLQVRDAVGTAPVVVLSGFGAGDSAAFHGPLAGAAFRLLLGRVYRDKTALDEMVAASGLRWVIARPGMLTNGASTGPARVQADYVRGMRVGAIPRRTVAEFMVGQAESPTLLGRKPALSAR